jgi:hypothetical protein
VTARILRNSAALLEHTFYADEVATAADGTVAVVITKADGSTLTSGTAAAVAGPPAKYTFSLPPQANLNHLDVSWSGTFAGLSQTQVDEVEIVGAFHLSLSEIRALDSAFAVTATYTAADLRRVRAEAEDAIEAEAGVAFVLRYARDVLDGRGVSSLLLDHSFPRTVRSVRSYTDATTYTSFTADELAAITYEDFGQLGSWSGIFASGNRNLVVEYEHGLDAPPSLIRRAARILTRQMLLADKASSDPSLANVRSLSVEGYSVSYGEGGGTGSKAADDLIDQWKRSTSPAGVAFA